MGDAAPGGALLGGYFGTWLAPEELASRSLDAGSFGCGVLAVLGPGDCPIVEAADILAYLAAETAGQCGPCVNGLGALSECARAVAESRAAPGDRERVERWIPMIRGRGGCHHPDGAVGQLESAYRTFPFELAAHLAGAPCSRRAGGGFPRPPAPGRGWR